MIAQHPLFVQFIVYFNENQDYFECHEVLEELWKKKEPIDKEHWLVALILLSTGLYHWRRGNRRGAEKTLQNAQRRFRLLQPIPSVPFSWEQLQQNLDVALCRIKKGESFTPFPLVIEDPSTIRKMRQMKQTMPLLERDDQFLIHKHTLRDRSSIISEREKAKRERKNK